LRNWGFVTIEIAGISINAHSRHKRIEKMIKKAKLFRITSPEKKSTANPTITEKAFIATPRPVVIRVQ
jgi:uncharacterized membrane protein